MSAPPQESIGTMEDYQGTGLIWEEEEYATKITKEATRKAVDSRVLVPEIYGLAITGIISLLAIIVTLALHYTVISLIFTIPLVGVFLGFGYIGYLKKYGRYQ